MGTTIGVAGCGAMGLPMARRLLAAGFDVVGLDVRPAREFGDFTERMVTDPKSFSRRCSTVVSVVRDARQTHDLLFDRQGICSPGTSIRAVLLSSTLSPRTVGEVRDRLDPNIALVDAPMSGAPAGARAGSLTFMVGGADEDVERCLPLLRTMGAAHYHCGPLGHGMTVKVLNNYVAVSSVVAVRRVLGAAGRLGIEGAYLREVMSRSSGATWYGDKFDAIDWAGEGYDPGNTIGILEKDLAAAVDAMAGGAEPALLEAALGTALRALSPIDGE